MAYYTILKKTSYHKFNCPVDQARAQLKKGVKGEVLRTKIEYLSPLADLVGEFTARRLAKLGITTIAQLRERDSHYLKGILTKESYERLVRMI